MYKIILCILALTIQVFAHKLILNVLDNGDDTITIQGSYDTGQSATNAKVILQSLNGEILYEKRLPDESELTIKIPTQPYKIVLDGGIGHQAIKEGIEPQKGFTKQTKKSKQTNINTQGLNLPSMLLLIVAILLFILTIYFSYKNTNKLLKQLEKKSEYQ